MFRAASFLAFATALSAAPLRFDFGPAGSSAPPGYVTVSPATRFTAARGYGFLDAPAEAAVIDDSITVRDARGLQDWRVKQGFLPLGRLDEDYVAGAPLRFQAALANGKYDVVATLGYKIPMHHLIARANGREIRREFSVYTYHFQFRGMRDDTSIGGVYRLPFTVDVTDGKLIFELTGDPSKGSTKVTLKAPNGQTMDVETGAPYKIASIMAMTIAPHRAPTPEVAKALDLMKRAGDPEVDDPEEGKAIGDARRLLEAALKREPDYQQAAEHLEDVRLFETAVKLFHNRRTGATEHGVVANFHKSHGVWRQFTEGHPFHWKGLLYSARMFKGFIPFSFTPKSEEAMDYFRAIEKRWPKNKYARLYLYDDWSPRDWRLNEYPAPPGTPKWAENLRRGFNQTLDFAEWWADFRQQPDGSLGGGWNDDVEIMPVFVINWMVSPSSSPKIARMLEKFTEGLWAGGDLDTRAAFSASFFDAEHAAEDQGNSLPYLIAGFYGNPRYLDWNLRTIQLFRNYMTAVNERGRRHFRSHHFDATRYALDLAPEEAHKDVEAAICYRAFGCVPWMIWYNGNPVAKRLAIEHADSWLDAAMRTDKGKPKGVIPNQLGFNDEIGGPAPTWLGRPGLGGGANWPDYLFYLNNLLLNAYRITGDRKYIAPFEEMQAIAARHRNAQGGYTPAAGAKEGTEAWVYNHMLRDQHFSDAFQVARDLTGDKRWDDFLLKAGTPYARFRLTGDRSIVADDMQRTVNSRVRQRWPHMTHEGVMTDRIGYLPQAVAYMMGAPAQAGYAGIPIHAVTYEGAGRDFAALVEDSSEQKLRIVFYSFADRPRPVGVRPWRLQTGARYQVKTPAGATEVTLAERGQIVPVTVPPNREFTIEFTQTAPGAPARHADLAVSAGDLRWNTETDQIEATITNIGGAEAHNVELAFYHVAGPERKLLERAVISRLGPPDELHLERVTVGTWNHRDTMREGDDVLVVVDPDNKQREIAKSNNSARFRLALDPAHREALYTKRLTSIDRRILGARMTTSTRPKVRYLSDVVYGADDPRQRVDAFLIEGAKPAPVIIEFHGGGWRNGQKGDLDQYGGLLRKLIDEGYSLVSAGYRLTPKWTWPAQGDDTLAVVRFVRSKAKEWNIDPERVVLLGGSAGAHLALWAGLQNLADARVAAIVDLWGPSDLAMISPRVARGEALTALFNTTVEAYESGAIKERLAQASPVTYVKKSSPPVFITHQGPADATSAEDPRISGRNMGVHSAAFGLRLAERLRAAGVAHEVLITPEPEAFVRRAVEFVKKHAPGRR